MLFLAMNSGESAVKSDSSTMLHPTLPLWPDVQRQFALEPGGTTAGLLIHNVRSLVGGSISVAVNIGPAFQRGSTMRTATQLISTFGVSRWVPGLITGSHEFIDDSAVLRSEYYNDFLRRYDRFHIVGCFMALEDGQIGSISSFRSLKDGPFPDSTLQMMRLVLPHFERAAKLHAKLGLLQAGFESLDLLNSGLIFVRANGEVLQMNRHARELAQQGDGIRIILGRLSAWHWDERLRLQTAVNQAAAAAMGNGVALDGPVVIHRQSGKRPLVLFVAPLRNSRLFNSWGAAGAVVFVHDPEREPQLSESVLQSLYKLTPAQAKLAVAIARGRDLNEYCEEADVRRTTARTHLRLIFDKLGVRRQAEVAALVLNTQGAIRAGEMD